MFDSEKRFITVYSKGVSTVNEIVVDTKTGVNYLFHKNGYGGGLTPLLDSEGKVVVSKEYINLDNWIWRSFLYIVK